MKKSVKLSAASLILVILAMALACCPKTQLCCHKYNIGSDLATYCNNHRNAVAKYFEAADNDSERRLRFDNFKQFYSSVAACTTVQCIETEITNSITVPGFWEFYVVEHKYAEQETQIDPNVKAEGILCGFKHAIDAFEKLLSK
jgi:hypothetical protein